MKILVTGATGFIGRALSARLEAGGHQVVKLSSSIANLRRPDSLAPYSDVVFDRIYHLAAWTQAGDFCLRHPGEQWIVNQQINTNVVAWWQEHQPGAKFICMGSSCAYDPELPLQETNYLSGTPIDSLFTYAMTKRMLYAGVRALREQFDLRYLCVVPSTVYGPGYHTDGRQMHFIFDVIRKVLRAAAGGEPVTLWGDGLQRRELIYIDDFVDITLWLAEHVDNELVNVGAGEEFTIREFAKRVCAVAGYDSTRVRYDVDRYVGARSKCLDVSKLDALMPNRPATPLDVGLGRTIAWFDTQRELLAKS